MSMKNVKTKIAGLLLGAMLIAPVSAGNAFAQEENAKLHQPDGFGKLASVGLATSTSTVNKPAVAPHVKNNAPNRIVATFNGDTRTQMGFNWYTSDQFQDAYVWVSESNTMAEPVSFKATAKVVEAHYIERDKNGFLIFAKVKTDENKKQSIMGYFTDEGTVGESFNPSKELGEDSDLSSKVQVQKVKEASYKALATGLKPNTQYYYQVGSDKGQKSAVGQFKTSGDSGDTFKFIHYTDTQNAYWNEHARNEAAYGASTLEKALETAGDANFVVHTGDVVEIAEVEDEWVDLFSQSQSSLLMSPLAPASGNHDEAALTSGEKFLDSFNNHFNVPAAQGKIDGGSYYSYDYNGVHFVVANTNDNKNEDKKALGKEQMDWIRQDVEQARKKGAKWVVLQYHKPLFSKSYHSLSDEDVQNVREDFMKLIDDLDIDVAMQGHDHVMSVTKSLKYAPKSESFANAQIDYANMTTGADQVEYYDNPQGTVFILPNTGGTKAYDDIYGKSLEHIKQVRPKLSWLTQENLDHYNSLFAFGNQPQKSEKFTKSHSNNRDSSQQNFAVYEFNDNELTVKVYQVYGDLSKYESRQVKLVHEFGIQKQ